MLQQWGRYISLWDGEGWSNNSGWRIPYQCVGDVHIGIVAKLFKALAKRVGDIGWNANQFLEAGPTRCMACFACTDGTSERSTLTPYCSKERDNPWMILRPCIVAVIVGVGTDAYELPFYCLALAKDDSRPLICHRSTTFRRWSLPPLRMV
ncbi:hypothetical protein N9L68_06200 [bacterium]|nr:hypothetical protein [bacterium]